MKKREHQWFYDECEKEFEHQNNSAAISVCDTNYKYKGQDNLAFVESFLVFAFKSFVFNLRRGNLKRATRYASCVACEMMRAIREAKKEQENG